MLGTLIHFPLQFQEQYTHFMTLLSKHFGTTKVSSSITSINNIQGPGRSFNDLLKELNGYAAITLWNTPKRVEELLGIAKASLQGAVIPQNGTVEDAFYLGMCSRYIASSTIVSYLLLTMRKSEKKLKEVNNDAYDKCCGYLLILSTVLSFNSAVIFSTIKDETINQQKHLNKCFDWIALFEEISLLNLSDGFCIELRQLLIDKIIDFQVALLNVQRALPEKSNKSFLPDELIELVNAKNKRAERFGTTYQGVIIRNATSQLMYDIDPIAMKELIEQISDINKLKAEHPRQFIFYCNQKFGPIELLSVYFNAKVEEIELVNLSLDNSLLQHRFLQRLNEGLCLKKIKFRLLACQADLLPEPSCIQLYAFTFSGILAKAVFEKIQNAKYLCSQPSFYSVITGKKEIMPTINHVLWFKVMALGDKAILMSPTHHKVRSLFEIAYGIEEALRRVKFYMRKYDLVLSSQFDGKFQYVYEYLFNKYQGNQDFSMMEIESRILDDEFDESKAVEASKAMCSLFDASSSKREIKKITQTIPESTIYRIFKDHKFTPKDPSPQFQLDAKTLRRAAAGFCPIEEFEFVLESFSQLSITQEVINAKEQKNQENTPLHLALSRDFPRRTLLLLEHNADTKLKNKAGKSPQEIYAELPEHSLVKRNAKIRAFFK